MRPNLNLIEFAQNSITIKSVKNQDLKVYIFEKKEILLLLSMALLGVIGSFAFGVRMGRNYSFSSVGITKIDQETIKLKSREEELVDEIVGKKEKDIKPNLDYKNLEKEFSKLEKEIASKDRLPTKEELLNARKTQEVREEEVIEEKKSIKETFKGRFTIQLGSYKLQEDAMNFADGFKIRGYNPIVREVIIPEKGTWYRVSLGNFDSMSDARDYIRKEESLFHGQDYVITELE